MIIIVSSLEVRLSIFPVPASVPDELILMRLYTVVVYDLRMCNLLPQISREIIICAR